MLQCLCRILTAGSPAFKVGDFWHCDTHRCADMRIIAVRDATLAQREQLLRS